MICIKNPISGECARLEDAEAHKRVNQYRWVYIPNREYKAWQVKKMEEGRGTRR